MKYIEECRKKLKEISGKKLINILAFESSCDETACAVLQNDVVLSNIVASQIDIHKRFGGVVPEIASRNHTLAIKEISERAIKASGLTLSDIDCIGVTYGAGLLGALLVGVSYAKALAFSLRKPLIAINHIKGHIAANHIENHDLKPPYLCLIVSGGNTAVAKVLENFNVSILGETVDDAAGEAFDKVARSLGLPYPGGPEIERVAKLGSANIELPTPLKGQAGFDFSFSGLKTAVINHLANAKQRGEEISVSDVARSFEEKATDILVETILRAADKENIKTIVVAGGVGANARLREKLAASCVAKGIKQYFPPLKYCTDNAAMIGISAYFMIKNNCLPADLSLDANASLRIND